MPPPQPQPPPAAAGVQAGRGGAAGGFGGGGGRGRRDRRSRRKRSSSRTSAGWKGATRTPMSRIGWIASNPDSGRSLTCPSYSTPIWRASCRRNPCGKAAPCGGIRRPGPSSPAERFVASSTSSGVQWPSAYERSPAMRRARVLAGMEETRQDSFARFWESLEREKRETMRITTYQESA